MNANMSNPLKNKDIGEIQMPEDMGIKKGNKKETIAQIS